MNIWLEWDHVQLAPDLTYSVEKAIQGLSNPKNRKKAEEEFLLAYVACSRAKIKLDGAGFLEEKKCVI